MLCSWDSFSSSSSSANRASSAILDWSAYSANRSTSAKNAY